MAIARHCYNATGRCYWMSTEPDADWSTARKNCQSQGGDLAVIETEELWDFYLPRMRSR